MKIFFLIFITFLQLADTLAKHIAASIVTSIVKVCSDSLEIAR